jgi:hypothetical protein
MSRRQLPRQHPRSRPSEDILSRFDEFWIFYYTAGAQATRAFYGKISFPDPGLQHLKKFPSDMELFGNLPVGRSQPRPLKHSLKNWRRPGIFAAARKLFSLPPFLFDVFL